MGELQNALDQVRREIGTRFDFKGAVAQVALEKDELLIVSDSELRLRAIRDLVESKAVRRGISLKVFDWGVPEEAGRNQLRQQVGLRRGLPDELQRRISRIIREEFPRVKGQVQGDAVRVSAKSKDDLQKVIARLRALDADVALQFENYR
ncbi:MAG: YajQ family cyclic di-GMP-binding protein [Chloroflexi bacterium]|nr:YajQ family cyclic di-GMP-binding protein [Chloroflexota bacterium]